MVPDLLVEIATRHAVHFEGLKTRSAREFETFLRAMEDDIISQLARVTNPGSLTERRLDRLLKAVRATLDNGYGDYEKVWRQQIREIGIYEAEFELKALGQVVEREFVLPTPVQIFTAAFAEPLSVEGPDKGKLLGAFYRDWTGKQKARIVNAIRLASAQGQTTAQLVQTIRGTRAGKFKDGIIEANRRETMLMARTSLQHVSSQAQQTVYDQNKDLIPKVEWVSVLDSRTSPMCRGLDGVQFDRTKGPRPPIHIGCRSRVVPVLRGKLRLLQGGGKQFSRGEKGVKYVNADWDYYKWLRTQSAGFQDEILGKKRARLLRGGGLSAERFRELQLDKKFKERTLDEMRELEPLAFEQAGI